MIVSERGPDDKFADFLESLLPGQRLACIAHVKANVSFCWDCGNAFADSKRECRCREGNRKGVVR